MNEIRESRHTVIFANERAHNVGRARGGAIDASKHAEAGARAASGSALAHHARRVQQKHRERLALSVASRRCWDHPSIADTISIAGARAIQAHHGSRAPTIGGAGGQARRPLYDDRFFPDKAIDVIDEACARARLSVSTVPSEIHEIEKKLEEVVKEKEAAIRGQEYEKAARLRDKEKELRARRNELKKSWSESTRGKDVQVDEELIASVLSVMTGIPVVKLAEEETQKLLRMEQELSSAWSARTRRWRLVSRAYGATGGAARPQASDRLSSSWADRRP